MAIEKRYQAGLKELRQFFFQNRHCYVPTNRVYANLYEWGSNGLSCLDFD